MADLDLELVKEQIHSSIETGQVKEAVALLLDLHPADQADVFEHLDEEIQAVLLPLLNIQETADLLEELEDKEALEAVEAIPTERLADILDEMEPDEAADLLGDLTPSQASEALAQMEDADEVIPLLGYPDETAGGLMTTSFIALRRQTTAEQAIQFLRQVSPDTDIPYYLYVVDREKRLVGVVGLRELVVAPPQTKMEAITDYEVIYVTTGMDQEEVARTISRYDLPAVPVVDENHHLVGVITVDDIVDVIEDETTEDIYHLGAVEAGPVSDKPYWSQHIFQVVRSRFFWLLILFIAETFTGTVLRVFEEEVQAVVALAIFIPLLIGTGGNAGSQTVATVIRALSLREIRTRDIVRVWWREVRTGLLLGMLIGIVALGWAFLWGVGWELALTVSLSVMAICLWANMVAALVPIIANKVGIDPTIVSGPLMTTLIDGTGLIIYFSLAALILPQL
jgi:magnesium transporter